MKYVIFISLGFLPLFADTSEDVLELVDNLKLVEKYGYYYSKYESYGAEVEVSEETLNELPHELRLGGLRLMIAEEIEKSLSPEEISQAHAFFKTEAGKKLAVAVSFSKPPLELPLLDMHAAAWGTQRNDKIREITVQKNTGGKGATPYVNNLRKIVGACQQFMLEQGEKEAAYSDVVGIFFKEIQPINGESYKDIIVYEVGGVVAVTNADEDVFEFKYGPLR